MLKEYNRLWTTTGILMYLLSSCRYSLYVDNVAVICNNAVLLRRVPVVTNYLGLKKKKKKKKIQYSNCQTFSTFIG